MVTLWRITTRRILQQEQREEFTTIIDFVYNDFLVLASSVDEAIFKFRSQYPLTVIDSVKREEATLIND